MIEVRDDEFLGAYAQFDVEYDRETGLVRIRRERSDRVTEAFVIEPYPAGVLDINGAQAVYLSQPITNDKLPDRGRTPLRCVCSDERCRELADPPSIVPVAYRTVQGDGSYKQRAHWRWEPDDWHHALCNWIVREIGMGTIERGAYEPGEAEDAASDGARAPGPLRSDHIDVLVLRRDGEDGDDANPGAIKLHDRATGRDLRGALLGFRRRYRNEQRHPSRAELLRQVVSDYDRLKAENRHKTEMLTIGGVTRTFYDWFRVVSKYVRFLASDDRRRIWSGGANVTETRDGYAVVLRDEAIVDGLKSRPRMFFSFDTLANSPRGPYLREALREVAAGEADYVKCYWFGDLERDGDQLVPDFENMLQRVHLAPRRVSRMTVS